MPVSTHFPESLPPALEKAKQPRAKAAFDRHPLSQWRTMLEKVKPQADRKRAQAPRKSVVEAPEGLLAPVVRSRAAVHQLTDDMLVSEPLGPPQVRALDSDADQDGLPESTEQVLWYNFVPRYYVSVGEKDAFAFFRDDPNNLVDTGSQISPPVGYYSVQPLFVAPRGGVPYGWVQINYLTFWNNDSGLSISDTCRGLVGFTAWFLGFALVDLVNGLGGHHLDTEHSAALVGAPTVGDRYDPNAGAYRLFGFYTAAHENKPSDHSMYLFARRPIEPGYHLQLALTLSKHATYAFNPDGRVSLVPDEIVYTAFWLADALLFDGVIDEDTYYFLIYLFYTVFYVCVVEHWRPRDNGVTPSPVINVGKPDIPLNHSAWIKAGGVPGKLAPRWGPRAVRWVV